MTFLGRCARSFMALQGIDRALVIASQAFTALIPLLLLVAALAPSGNRDLVSSSLIRRFRLTGDAADAVRQLFAHSGDSVTGVLSVFLLVFSGVSLTRRMQRMYQQAWRLEPPPGVRHAVHATLGLSALLLGFGLLYMARALVERLPLSEVLLLIVSVLVGFLLWTSVPWLLLDRRVAWRRLIPSGALTSVCTSLYGIVSTVYMPRLLESYSRRYGLFGVTLALVGWLLAMAFILVAAAVTTAEFDRAPEPWARHVRRRLRIEPSAAEVRPPDAVPSPPPATRPAVPGRPPAGTPASDRSV
jgi:membrane protein